MHDVSFRVCLNVYWHSTNHSLHPKLTSRIMPIFHVIPWNEGLWYFMNNWTRTRHYRCIRIQNENGEWGMEKGRDSGDCVRKGEWLPSKKGAPFMPKYQTTNISFHISTIIDRSIVTHYCQTFTSTMKCYKCTICP